MTEKKILWALAVVVFVVFYWLAFQRGTQPGSVFGSRQRAPVSSRAQPVNPQRDTASSLAAKAAMIDYGSSAVSTLEDRYARLLERLDHKCSESRTKILDMATFATQAVKEDFQREVKILDVLVGLDGATASLQPGADCAQLMAVLIVLLGKG